MEFKKIKQKLEVSLDMPKPLSCDIKETKKKFEKKISAVVFDIPSLVAINGYLISVKGGYIL